jgi:hypothetical protein
MLREYCAYFVVETAFDGETKEEAGFYPANTFGEAMDYIEEFFGDELCVVKHLELLDSPLLYMRPEVAKEIVVYNYG